MQLDDKLRQAADEARSEGKTLYGNLMDEAADALQSKDGGFAFPQIVGYREGDVSEIQSEGGMTQRDCFAGQAMQGMIASRVHTLKFHHDGDLTDTHETQYDVGEADVCAEHAYIYADKMLAQREKQEGK